MTHPLNNTTRTWPFARPATAGRTPVAEVPRTYILGNANQFSRLIAPWRRLQQTAVEPTIAAAPGWLLPMYRHADPQAHGAVTIAVLGDTADRLAAVVPLHLQPARWLLPLPCLTTWSNDFCFSGLPMIAADKPSAALETALRAARESFYAKAVLFEKIPAEGPFMAALHDLSQTTGQPLAIVDAFERAGLETGQEFEAWFAGNFKRKKRKELRRLRTRLGEQGTLECLTYQPGEDLSQWIDEFLSLESAGWKGRAGTALACNEAMSGFLETALPMLQANRELIFWKLALDGKPLAMLFAMLSGDQAWLGKIAFDEDYARFSPGVLLVLDVTRDLLSRDGIRRVDSSAIPDHPMINHIWRDRIAMNDVLIATPGTAQTTFHFIKTAEQARRHARSGAKSIYHRLFKGKTK